MKLFTATCALGAFLCVFLGALDAFGAVDPECVQFDVPNLDAAPTWAVGVDISVPGVGFVGMCTPSYAGAFRYSTINYTTLVSACVIEIDGITYRSVATKPGQLMQVFVGTEVWDPDQQRTARAWCENGDGSMGSPVMAGIPVTVPVPLPAPAPLQSAP